MGSPARLPGGQVEALVDRLEDEAGDDVAAGRLEVDAVVRAHLDQVAVRVLEILRVAAGLRVGELEPGVDVEGVPRPLLRLLVEDPVDQVEVV